MTTASTVLLLSACSGGGGGPAATSSTAASVPTSTSTSTAASGPAPACTTRQLMVTVGTGGAAAGEFAAPFVVTDTAAACSLAGYFGLALLNANGRPLGPSPVRDAGITESTSPVGAVVVHGSTTAVFAFQWPYADLNGGTCVTATSVELTAPDQTDHITIPARTGGGQPIVLCGNGQSFIGPVTA